MLGRSAGRQVLLGFAPASLLQSISFADVLDDGTGIGYQRRLNRHHSLDFWHYIQREGSTTITLTFNLRPSDGGVWRLEEVSKRNVRLHVLPGAGKVLAQVDCQHRLGHMGGSPAELPFMCFIGLFPREEMEVFNVINSKARGLSPSLLDFHDAQLAGDVALDRPELYVALCLRNDRSSPWFGQLDLGGEPTSGMVRRASLRTMQKAVKVFLGRTKAMRDMRPDAVAHLVIEFWSAVSEVFPDQWAKPRKHLLTKGLGVYAMMEVAADLYAGVPPVTACDRQYFASELSLLAQGFDWTNEGPLRGLGGEGGVKAAVGMIRSALCSPRLRAVSNG